MKTTRFSLPQLEILERSDDYTELELNFPKDSILELTFYESSNDLLSNPEFTVPERPETSIPMPFVLNDAILVIKTLRFE